MRNGQLAAVVVFVAAAITADTLLTWANSDDHGAGMMRSERTPNASRWISGPHRAMSGLPFFSHYPGVTGHGE
jgi:hypothetical protein